MEIMVMFLWVDIYLQIPHVVYLKYVQLFLYVSYLNKAIFLKKEKYQIQNSASLIHAPMESSIVPRGAGLSEEEMLEGGCRVL